MSIQISRKCDYAMKAMARIASLKEGELYTAKSISKQEKIPLKFLEKILQALVGHGLLKVTYGPKGGYKLSKRPEEITFKDIMEAVEGPVRLNLCVGDAPECDGADCVMRNHWERLQDEIVRLFGKANLGETIAPLSSRGRGN